MCWSGLRNGRSNERCKWGRCQVLWPIVARHRHALYRARLMFRMVGDVLGKLWGGLSSHDCHASMQSTMTECGVARFACKPLLQEILCCPPVVMQSDCCANRKCFVFAVLQTPATVGPYECSIP